MLRNKELFGSVQEPVPSLRRDIQLIPIQDSGKELLYFHDSMGYLTKNFALHSSVKPVLGLLNGETSIKDICEQLNGSISETNLLNFIQLLDQNRALQSDYFLSYADQLEVNFEKGQTRPAVLAGQSYPEDPNELQSFVQQILSDHESTTRQNPQALYAPHIELSVGRNQYGEAFSQLKDAKPERVIILGTSHYAGYYYNYYQEYPFIGSAKVFQIPGRSLSTHSEIIKSLSENSPENGFTLNDRAHRVEHSIEFHLLFASAIWTHEFQIVPILISGFDDLYYMEDGDIAKKIDRFASQLRSFIDEKTIVLISGDLSHVGQKFGDSEPASSIRESVEESDKQFLDISVTGNPDKLLDHLKKDYDSTRICGFPPLYTYLKMFPDKTGELLNYYWWDEKERNSAVSFGSIVY